MANLCSVPQNNCSICDYSLNNSTRMPISCLYCEFTACRTCCETYVIGETVSKCMNLQCNKEWTRQFISSKFTNVFITKKLQKRREDILFDIERSLLPATQPLVERIVKTENITNQLKDLRDKIYALNHQKWELQNQLYRLNNTTGPTARAEFVRACPDGDCRGFLSSQWKCGICEKWSCPDCHEVKGLQRDDPHECNPDTLATARLLSNDTKPCPKCRTGIFKIDGCFAKDTSILLWNGTQKLAQDVCIGDVLVGDDGKKRIVEKLFSGEDDLYEINQKNGINYTVNSKHTLVLKFTGDAKVHWADSLNSWKILWFDVNSKKMKSKSFKVTIDYDKETAKTDADAYLLNLNIDDVIVLTVSEYLELDASSKKNLFGFKSNSGICYPSQDVYLDPYILGLWLGDGTHTQPIIASNDLEIQTYINSWCQSNDAELIKEDKYKLRIRRRGQSNGRETVDGKVYDNQESVQDKSNPFTKLLKKYNLIGNKHIPIDYILNSRETRLKLLAGLIDTDGHSPRDENGKRVVIIQSNYCLSKQIIYLAQSLGFVVNYSIRERKKIVIFDLPAKDYKDQFVINISGEFLHEIPTILPRKKCVGTISNKDYFRTAIEVLHKGVGKYYGWSISENKRFLLSDFTVARNCDQMWCTQCHTAFNWRTGRVEAQVHNPHYFEWLRRNGNAVPRNPLDNLCQQDITHQTYSRINTLLRTKYENGFLSKPCSIYMEKLIRNILHMRYVILPRYEVLNRERRNEHLRIQYMRKFINDNKFKTTLQRNEKKCEKNREISNILDILKMTVTDIIMRFITYLEANTGSFNIDILEEIDPIVDYANNCLSDISRVYSSKRLEFSNELREK